MHETSSTIQQIALAGAVVGFLLGITIVWTRFCTMGAVADIAISGNFGRMRSWLLAICIAIIGTQLASSFDLIDITETSYLQARLNLLGAIIGGGMFGFGMVFACGCG
ncbi:MAG: putative membrane protein YedE/YeeE, partial [Gammaproteobacteria bacterium]